MTSSTSPNTANRTAAPTPGARSGSRAPNPRRAVPVGVLFTYWLGIAAWRCACLGPSAACRRLGPHAGHLGRTTQAVPGRLSPWPHEVEAATRWAHHGLQAGVVGSNPIVSTL
jgi:hypothetical protein